MSKKINYEEFLTRAQEVWGDKFTYLRPQNFDYRKGRIQINCNLHGSYKRVPMYHVTSNKHRKPAGCPDCFREADRKAKMKPFSAFLKDAKAIHGEKYEYAEDTYDGARQNMEIICPKHGPFPQTPDAHINNKQGCALCADEATSKRNVTKGLKNAKKKLRELTSDKVKLLDESYKEQREEAQFVCKEHGEFTRIVILALTSVYPCKECSQGKANTNILSKQEIYNKILEKEGNFNILEILGEGRDADIKVECFDCDRGEYITSVNNSYRYKVLCGNCRRIASEPHRKSMQAKFHEDSLEERTNLWLSRFYKKWGDRYDYSEINFKSAREAIKVICNKPHHPPFYPTAHSHLTKGCRLCANEALGGKYSENFFEVFPTQKDIEGRLYYLQLEYCGQLFYKVGITKNRIETRHSMLNSIEELDWKILGEKKTTLFKAFKSEQEIQREHGNKFRQELPIDSEEARRCRIGPTECFFERISKADFEKYFDP